MQVAYLGTCSFNGKPPLEDIGNALGDTIRKLNVPQVDVVTHSTGGLILRSYLSGKQSTSGVFNPPLDTKVRKWVAIAAPNFGALLPGVVAGFLPDVQAREVVPGSQFLFDLATWNQNHDDLRGVDAVAIIGNAAGFGPFDGASDGTVSLTSASLSFAEPDERTRILPYCHGASVLSSILGLGCDAPPLAKLQSDNPLSWHIIDSFLSGTEAWKTAGHSPTQDKYLSTYGGTLTQQRDNMDRPAGSIQDQNFVSNAPRAGAYTIVITKPGPRIDLVLPSAARLSSLSLAPRMLVSIYGRNLAGSTLSINGQTLPQTYSSDTQINTLLPNNLSGLAKLTITGPLGQQTVNTMIEDAVPAIFTTDGSGTGNAAAIRVGSYVSLYLTGLGMGTLPPSVLLNGVPVTVTYAGVAPGFSGLDQINFRLPDRVSSGTVAVIAGRRTSNVVTLPAP